MEDLGIRVLFMGNNFQRLLEGMWITIRISLLAAVLSFFFGILFGMVMMRKNPALKILTRIYLEFIRIMPQLVLLFLVFFGAAGTFGINLSGEASAVIVFTMWGTGEMGDLVRSALSSIPRHQHESGAALGMRPFQISIYLILPQAFRRLIPPAVNLITRMIKTTSLVALIGVVEAVKIGQQIIEANRYTVPDATFWIYGTIFLLYFVVCRCVSGLASLLEQRLQRRG